MSGRRRMVWVIGLALALALPCAGQHKRMEKQSASVRLNPARMTAKLSESIVIEVIVTNTSRKTSMWPAYFEEEFRHYRDLSYGLTLDGKPVKKTKLLRELTFDLLPDEMPKQPISVVSFPVKPGESRRYKIDLRDLYEMTEPGTYTLLVGPATIRSSKPIWSKPAVIVVTP